MRPSLLLFALAVLTTGCATNLSTLQTGKTLEPKQVRVSAGAGLYLPAGQVLSLLAAGTDLSGRAGNAVATQTPYQWTQEDEETLLTTALALAVLPPAPVFELNLRVGLFKNFDAGFRYSTNALRLDAKYRFFHSGDEAADGSGGSGRSTDVAVGVGGSKYLFKNPVVDLLGYVKMDDFSRWDVEATVYASHDFSRYFGLYGAPKYVFSTTSMDEHLVSLSQTANDVLVGYGTFAAPDVRLPSKVNTHFIGGTVGLRAGVPQVSLYLELTLGATVANVALLGKTRALGGFTVYPAGGLVVTF